MELKSLIVNIDDFDKAIGFYRDALGLEVRMDIGSGQMRWVTLGSPGKPNGEIVLASPEGNPDVPSADRQAITELLAKGMLGFFIFTTDDVDAAFEKARATGAEVMQEPIDQPYGVRDCAFRDPAGNIVRINTPTKG